MIFNREYQGKLSKQGSISDVSDLLAVEVPLEIQLNGPPFSTTMCTPSQMKELVFGLFVTEGLMESVVEVAVDIQFDSKLQKHIAVAKTKKPIPQNRIGSRELLSVTSCGICGNTHFEKAKGEKLEKTSSPAPVSLWFQKMEEEQSHFQQTGGTHAAALFNENNEMIALGQDIGRHNAVDKAIGHAYINQ
ncbi:MAG: formate dehydrogenase accessory sulfurtransferase FdhD, partial [Flavobacteriales bacterium]|nr:formate dehydrogenase accessory sulfurtransferase FdhD [Flavobacteriales bacterium]